jgi:exonuclease III
MREEGSWEEPRGEVVRRLDERGWIDLWRLARVESLEGYARALDAPADHPGLPTCWAGTRIDYLWASPALAGRSRLVRCGTVPSDVSDHLPVIAELVPVAA